jgi:hypothetical protein
MTEASREIVHAASEPTSTPRGRVTLGHGRVATVRSAREADEDFARDDPRPQPSRRVWQMRKWNEIRVERRACGRR